MNKLLQKISSHAFSKESDCINEMLPFVEPFEDAEKQITKQATKLVEHLRSGSMGISVEAFLNEYSLSSKEGIAIMCLAETLLRIPNKETADKLIESTFTDTKWQDHLGKSESFYVNASSWGLLLTGKTVKASAHKKNAPLKTIKTLLKKGSEPVIRKALKSAMHLIASQFVMGESMDDAFKKAKKYEEQGYIFSYDMLGEGARNQDQADSYFASYLEAIEKTAKFHAEGKDLFDRPGVSIKLTALHPRYEYLKKERVLAELYPKLKELVATAKNLGICVAIDAEESTRLDIELIIFKKLCEDKDLQNFDGIGFVLQAYQKRAWHVVDFLIELAQKTNRKIPIRLVKGAYWDTEIKQAQIHGLKHYPVFTNKYHSDVSYLACARKILDNDEIFFPQFATHNAHTIAAIQNYAGSKRYEFQRLYGMGEKLYQPIVETIPCRIYAPIGQHKDLLAYLIRRLLENGANSSFVNIVTNKSIPVEDALEDPIAKAKEVGGKRNQILPLPSELYKKRENPNGPDFGNQNEMDNLQKELEKFANKNWNFKLNLSGKAKEVTNPSNGEIIGKINQADEKDIEKIINKSAKAFEGWKKTSANQRAEILENTAELIVQNDTELLALLIREAGKTIKDAIAELREAIDFCRYYAAQAKNMMDEPTTLEGPTGESNKLSLHPRGTFLCISPWNFPLAIFTGQITAALATGNCVLAKPAEQTPLIAARLTELLHQAGLPKDVMQLVTGKGSIIGAKMVESDIQGVCFTGSTAAAQQINRTLAAKDGAITPLIAETGGQNCMVADSTALLEQLSDDVLNSAFGSAGQRCSALRVLYLPTDIADDAIKLMSGALQELSIGNPWDFATDIGPVIDQAAYKSLDNHIKFLAKNAKLIAKKETDLKANFITPQIWEIDDISQLEKENFGPILHIIRYKPEDLQTIYDAINSTGFGLTFGLNTRIHERYEEIENQINAGNIYVNRGMTGAVVGTQPFGGEGLSGTGFKAGGPNYLLKFTTERTTTINTAAIGGNIDLLVKS